MDIALLVRIEIIVAEGVLAVMLGMPLSGKKE